MAHFSILSVLLLPFMIASLAFGLNGTEHPSSSSTPLAEPSNVTDEANSTGSPFSTPVTGKVVASSLQSSQSAEPDAKSTTEPKDATSILMIVVMVLMGLIVVAFIFYCIVCRGGEEERLKRAELKEKSYRVKSSKDAKKGPASANKQKQQQKMAVEQDTIKSANSKIEKSDKQGSRQSSGLKLQSLKKGSSASKLAKSSAASSNAASVISEQSQAGSSASKSALKPLEGQVASSAKASSHVLDSSSTAASSVAPMSSAPSKFDAGVSSSTAGKSSSSSLADDRSKMTGRSTVISNATSDKSTLSLNLTSKGLRSSRY